MLCLVFSVSSVALCFIALFYCLSILLYEIRPGELYGAGVVGPRRRNCVQTAAGRTTLYEGLQHECCATTLALKLQPAVWQGRASNLAAVGCQYELNQFPP